MSSNLDALLALALLAGAALSIVLGVEYLDDIKRTARKLVKRSARSAAPAPTEAEAAFIEPEAPIEPEPAEFPETENVAVPPAPTHFLFITDDINCWFVPLSEIYLLEAAGNYTAISLNGGKAMIRRSVSHCEARLDPQIFFRAHRACIVNLGCVKKVHWHDKKRLMFTMLNDAKVILSRKRSAALRSCFSL